MYEREAFILLKDLPKAFVEYLHNTPVSIAGGAVTSVFTGAKINDYDLCSKSDVVAQEVAGFLENNYPDKLVSNTTRAWTFNLEGARVQVLKSFNGFPTKILEKFDFTICQGLFSPCLSGDARWTFAPDFFTHLAQRRLVVNPFALAPVNSLLRIEKYKKKGYTISDLEILKLAMAIQKVHIETYDDLINNIAGGSNKNTIEDIARNIKEKDKNNQYDFEEFVNYLTEHEKAYYDVLSFMRTGKTPNENNEKVAMENADSVTNSFFEDLPF